MSYIVTESWSNMNICNVVLSGVTADILYGKTKKRSLGVLLD